MHRREHLGNDAPQHPLQPLRKTRAAEGLSFDVWMTFRKIVIELALATDMSKHLEMVGLLRTMIAPVNVEDAGTRLFLFRILLKCADIGHSAKSWDLHER